MAREDLIPMNKRTKDEVKRIAQKGGINSGKARREKKTFQVILDEILNSSVSSLPATEKLARQLGVEDNAQIKSLFTLACMFNSIKSGKMDEIAKAAELLGENIASNTADEDLKAHNELLSAIKKAIK